MLSNLKRHLHGAHRLIDSEEKNEMIIVIMRIYGKTCESILKENEDRFHD